MRLLSHQKRSATEEREFSSRNKPIGLELHDDLVNRRPSRPSAL